MNVKINETFFSVQGEGMYAGRMMLFVRLYSCNLDCSWCDQPNALSNRGQSRYREMDTAEVVDVIDGFSPAPVVFTGGEPCFQPEALLDIHSMLRERGEKNRMLSAESNGTIFLKPLATDPYFFLSCSPKFTSVRENAYIKAHGQTDVLKWVEHCGSSDMGMQLKFVIEDEQWFNAINVWLEENIAPKLRPNIPIVYQPEWFKGKEEFTRIVKKYSGLEEWTKLMDMGFREIRFQPQTHKLIHVR